MQMKQNKAIFKLIDETYMIIDGADIYELEIKDVHQERSLYIEQQLNIDNYANYFHIVIQPTANVKHASGRTFFDIFMNQSSIEEVCFVMEYEGQQIVEAYTFYQDSTSTGNFNINDYQKQFIDAYGCMCIDIKAQ